MVLLPHDTELLKEVGSRIKARREEQKILQVELAESTGLSETWLRMIEKGKTNPSISAISVICRKLDMKMSELFEGLS